MLINKLLVSLAFVLINVGSAGATTVQIEGLHIDSGNFSTDIIPAIAITSNPSVNLMLPPIVPGWNQAVAQTEAHETSIVSFEPKGDDIWANSYFSTAATGTVDASGLNNSINDGDSIEVNLSGFVVNFNGVSLTQGGTATSTISNIRQGPPGLKVFDYNLSWKTDITNGPFDGTQGSWNITGFGAVAASPVPIPAAIWIFGSAILGLIKYFRYY